MAIVLSIVAFTFAAFCIWLTVRIVNRREDSDDEFLAIVCVAVLALLVIIAPGIGIYLALEKVIRPNPGVAVGTMAVPPPVRPSGR